MVQTATELRDRVEGWLCERKLVVVANREPYAHVRQDGRIVCRRPAGGLVAALDPVMRACGGTWIAHGSGDADRVAADDRGLVGVPPEAPRYQLRRVWLDEAEQAGYYDGFANQALWPLCHRAFVRPRFERAHWRAYQSVNRRFASAVLEELADTPDAFVLVQDYHFALLPRLLRSAHPSAGAGDALPIGQFWHIPWPSHDALALCPYADDLLDGLLGNDVLGFHTADDCAAFLDAVERRREAIVDRASGVVQRQGRCTLVRPFPISVDAAEIAASAAAPSTADAAERLRCDLALEGQLIGLGVDRLDYTKGIPERLEAIDRFFVRNPSYIGRFTFLQLGPRSRVGVPAYRRLHEDVERLVAAVNARHGRGDWMPVRLLTGDHDHDALMAYYRLADVCVVSSLHDGMNLVAKEFVAARPDGDAVLVLSRFTGAAQELSDALLVNPLDVDGFADALRLALELPDAEKQRRMAAMRAAVAANTVYDWAHGLIAELARASGAARSGPFDPRFPYPAVEAWLAGRPTRAPRCSATAPSPKRSVASAHRSLPGPAALLRPRW